MQSTINNEQYLYRPKAFYREAFIILSLLMYNESDIRLKYVIKRLNYI